jgi:starch phosphorylase
MLEVFMQFLGRVTVDYRIPKRISKLKELAHNLWWCWNYDAKELFKIIDPDLFAEVGRNPVKLLKEVSHEKIQEIAEDSDFIKTYDEIIERYENYLNKGDTWFASKYPEHKSNSIAYFSAEFGFHESLPIYSGGLGILAGDHCKSASDLGLPLSGIGLLYKQGYFIQRLTADGWQESRYENHEFTEMPIEPVLNDKGVEILIDIDLPTGKVYAKVWRANIGRIKVYLLDTDISQNTPHHRKLTSQLYGGGNEMRICQEKLLGIGGVKAFRAMGIHPRVWHMNEGHSVFSVMERIREHIQKKGLNFRESLERIRGNTIFTTHTPVPAGNDAFTFELMDKYFKDYIDVFGISREEFYNLGKYVENGSELFSLTVFALRTAGNSNGVSELHGEVSRNIWEFVWEKIPTEEGPITHITNGVHTLTWLAPELRKFYDQYFERDWTDNIDDGEIWQKVDNIPDEDLWKTHTMLKQYMIWHIRKRVKRAKKRFGVSPAYIRNIEKALDPNVLTIGFARRFATYKRADLLLRDFERIKKIIKDDQRPVQFVFAGKAHPADQPGKEMLKRIYDFANNHEVWDRIAVIEDYDMELARYLVRGVDVWMNNPRRPLEASGTSGMKVTINGGINFSVLDGWWIEGYNGENGWTIGEEEEYDSHEHQDNADSISLYDTLENQIIPLYYDIDEEKGIPVKWIQKMKESMKTVNPVFNTNRMIKEYVDNLYINGIERAMELGKNKYELAKELAKWRIYIQERWNEVKVEPYTGPKTQKMNLVIGDNIKLQAKVTLREIKTDDVQVEIYYGLLDEHDELLEKNWVVMNVVDNPSDGIYIYEGSVDFEKKGDYGYTIRVVPYHINLPHKHDTGLITWLQ